MGTNRKMTAEVLAQQPGVVAVFVNQCGEHGHATDAWRATAARLFITASEKRWSNVVMHIDGGRSLHLLCEQGESIIVVMETGCKFAKNVSRSMRRALDAAINPPFVGSASEMGGYDQDDEDEDNRIDPQGRGF